MYNIFLLEKFNNYYNRRITKYDTLETYLSEQINNGKRYVSFQANFIPNDGVLTEHVINAQNLSMDWNPDYLLIVDTDNNIHQRWFVIDSVRTTMGQYRLSLKRDSVADYFLEASTAPAFIEKAILNDADPLIYNTENFRVNQIKQKEEFLKDATESAWIVGYLSNGELDFSSQFGDLIDNTHYQMVVTKPSRPQVTNSFPIVSTGLGLTGSKAGAPFAINGNLPDTKLTPMIEFDFIDASRKYFQFNFERAKSGSNDTTVAMVCNANGRLSTELSSYINYNTIAANGIYMLGIQNNNWQVNSGDIAKLAATLSSQESKTAMANSYSYLVSNNKIPGLYNTTSKTKTELQSIVGNRYYETSTGKTYYFRALNEVLNRKYFEITSSDQPQAFNILKEMFIGTNSPARQYFVEPDKYGPKDDVFWLGIDVPCYYYDVVVEEDAKLKYSIPKSMRSLDDAPYRMFCMPMSEIFYFQDTSAYRTISDVTLTVSMDISRLFTGAGWLSDIQIVPYCPVQNWVTKKAVYYNGGIPKEKTGIDLTTLSEYVDYCKIEISKDVEGVETWSTASYIFFARESSSSFTIDLPIPVTEKKIQNQCEFQRLCSPNYASAFQFNAVKNNGVDYFRVNMTLKPFNPFIQVFPNFKELYGSDFNDNRGLILSGDFSLPQVNDAWATFELQNKNYQASFDRSIEKMEFDYYSGVQDRLISGVGGVISGAAAGAAGGAVGGIPGAIIGGVVGGVASAAGLAADIAMGQYRFNEERQYRKDQFGMSLQNIQALPNTVSKTSALTINHKLFPFVEFYDCTPQEKEAFRNKIKYDSMTVGVINTNGISDYIREEESFIKALLIDLSIPDDSHISHDIAKEIYQGVRLKI